MECNLNDLSTEELQAELERRAAERVQEVHNGRRFRWSLLTREMVDAFCPEHDRSSCSDSSRDNGFNAARRSNRGVPRCTRCALLEALDGEHPTDFDLRLEVTSAYGRPE
jgi:hypothetical protein